MRDFKKVFRRLAVTAVLAVFVMASAIPSLAATYQDGTYSVPVSLSEGRMSHNAIVSPCSVTISGGQIYATIVFKRVSDDGIPQYSYFTTTAGTVYPQQYGAHAQIFNSAPLSTPHTLNYTLYFDDSAIPTVGGGSTGDNSAASNSASGDAKASEKNDDKKDEKAKEDSKDDKNAKASDKSKKADKKAAKKADDKKQTSAKASESKNSKLPLYIGGLVVSLGVAGVGILMILKIGKKK